MPRPTVRGFSWIVFEPGKPVANGFIERFTGRLRDECVNVAVFFTIEDVRATVARWQEDYNVTRPHSALRDQAPATVAADWVGTVQPTYASPEFLEPLTCARLGSPGRTGGDNRPRNRPIPQVSFGLDSRGGSPAPSRFLAKGVVFGGKGSLCQK